MVEHTNIETIIIEFASKNVRIWTVLYGYLNIK
jgi:hypothetical protein